MRQARTTEAPVPTREELEARRRELAYQVYVEHSEQAFQDLELIRAQLGSLDADANDRALAAQEAARRTRAAQQERIEGLKAGLVATLRDLERERDERVNAVHSRSPWPEIEGAYLALRRAHSLANHVANLFPADKRQFVTMWRPLDVVFDPGVMERLRPRVGHNPPIDQSLYIDQVNELRRLLEEGAKS